VRTAIDTNILSALLTGEVNAAEIGQLLDTAGDRGGLVVCPIVYVELRAVPGAVVSLIDAFLERTSIVVDWNLDKEIWSLAAERYHKYAIRKRKQKMGEPKRLIVDFIVGAHALLRADVLLTLDPRPYRRDFPELSLKPR
jgi:predicted nucleic acid-binding protein